MRRVARDYAERDKWACKSANDVDNGYMTDNETAMATTGPWAIGRLCHEQGRQKRWVAAQMGISPWRLSRLIAGDITLRLHEAARLAEIFGVPIETFVPRPPAEVAS